MCTNKRIRLGDHGKAARFSVVQEFNDARRRFSEKLLTALETRKEKKTGVSNEDIKPATRPTVSE